MEHWSNGALHCPNHLGSLQVMKTRHSPKKLFILCATLVAFTGSAFLLTGCNTTAAVVGLIAGASGAVVTAVVIAKYKANEQQKAAAAERARIATVALAAKPAAAKPAGRKQRAAVEAGMKNRAPVTVTAPATVKPQASARAETPAAPARSLPSAEEVDQALTHNLPAYLAVPVPRQEIAAEERGQATYMLWDTHRQQLKSDDVYVLKRDVRDGATVKLAGLKAQVASAD